MVTERAVIASVFTGLSVFAASAWGAPRLLAHRGGAHEFDENSMGAFRACYAKGVRGFETDIRLTKDGALVLLHDDKLERTTSGAGPVESLTAAEVKALKLKKCGEPVPLVQELLDYLKGKPDIFIELEMKTGNTNVYTEAVLERYCGLLHDAAKAALPAGAYSFTSFDMRALRVMRRLYPDASVTLIVGGALDEKQIKAALELGAKRISPVMDLTSRKAVKEAKKAGLEVTGWPTRSAEDYALGVALGFDCLTTDIPVKLHEAASGGEVGR